MADNSGSAVRKLGKSTLVVLFGVFVEIFISFIAKLMVAKELPQTGYGEVVVGLTFLTALGIVARLGLDVGIARNAVRYDGADRRGVLISSYLVAAVCSFILVVTLYFSAPVIAGILGNPDLVLPLQMVAAGVPALPLMHISIGAVRAAGRSGPKVIVQNFTRPISRILLLAGLVAAGANPVEILFAYVLSAWIAGVVAFYFAVRYTEILNRELGWEPKYTEMLNFSVPLMASSSIMFIMTNTDNLMIQYFVGSSEVALYDIAFMLGQTLTIFHGAVGFLFLPLVSELESEGKWEEIASIYRLVTKWIAFATLPGLIVFAAFPETVIRLTFGVKYIRGSAILPIIAIGYFVRAAAGPNKGLLSAAGMTRFIMLSNLAAASVNVILNVALIEYVGLGAFGAAIASMATFILLNLLYSLQIYRLHGVHPISTAMSKPILIYSLAATGVAVLLKRMTGQTIPLHLLVTVLIIGVFCYIATIFSFGGIESDDIMLLNSAEERLGVDLEPVKSIARSLM